MSMFNEVTREMYKARNEVISDIAHYAVVYAANYLSYLEESICQEGDIRDIYREGGRGNVTPEEIEESIIHGAQDTDALSCTDTHILVLAWQSYRYDGADVKHGAGHHGASLDNLLARALIDKVLENGNGELERVVSLALEG